MSEQHRPKVVVAGAGGSIGSDVSRALAKDYEVIGLVGAREQLRKEDPGLSLS